MTKANTDPRESCCIVFYNANKEISNDYRASNNHHHNCVQVVIKPQKNCGYNVLGYKTPQVIRTHKMSAKTVGSGLHHDKPIRFVACVIFLIVFIFFILGPVSCNLCRSTVLSNTVYLKKTEKKIMFILFQVGNETRFLVCAVRDSLICNLIRREVFLVR